MAIKESSNVPLRRMRALVDPIDPGETVPPPEPGARPRVALAADAPLPVGLEGIRVLVVDDEPDARDLVAYVLEACGMKVQTAGAASEALASLQTFAPHVIVSDIGMPREDGYMLIQAIRTLDDPARRAIPAIALTAFALAEDRRRALAAGFNQHMAKPIEPAMLVSAVVALAGHAGG